MTVSTVKRSQFATFINKTPSSTASYALIGDGVSESAINYNPQTTEETYIHQDTGNTSIASYRPTMPVTAKAKKGDEAFDFIDSLRKDRATLDDAVTDVVNVWLYEAAVSGAYPAEKQSVAIQIDTFGGPGGQPSEIGYTLLYQGNAVAGTFNPTTKAFTAS